MGNSDSPGFGGGNGNRAVVMGGGSGGRENIPEAQSQMIIDIEVAQLQYVIPSQKHEDALYLVFCSYVCLDVIYEDAQHT